jgi:hypothetical protein
MNGYTKPYFTDDTGRLFRDETTNLDNADTIPLEIEFGRNSFGTDQKKEYLAVLVDSENAMGAQLQYSLDGGRFETLGQLNNNVEKLTFPKRGQKVQGRDIDYKIVHNEPGAPAVINGLSTYFTVVEATPNGSI